MHMDNPTAIEAGDSIVVLKDRGFPLPSDHVVSDSTVDVAVEEGDPVGVIRTEDGTSIEVWGDTTKILTDDETHQSEEVQVIVDEGQTEMKLDPEMFDMDPTDLF